MFESNFPVDKDCISYRTLWNLFKKITSRLGLSDAEKTAVFSGTAARAYRLQAP
jgi:predicted TIM-barrel fold metal-dependent hydrolase